MVVRVRGEEGTTPFALWTGPNRHSMNGKLEPRRPITCTSQEPVGFQYLLGTHRTGILPSAGHLANPSQYNTQHLLCYNKPVDSCRSNFRLQESFADGVGDAMQKKYLFDFGCPRSGTTYFHSLLAWHPSVSLRLERYSRQMSARTLMPSHFDRQRFFCMKAGDTWYDNLSQFPRQQRLCEEHYDAAEYVGDKVPLGYEVFDHMIKHFAHARYICLVRNVLDVADKLRVSKTEDNALESVLGGAEGGRALECIPASNSCLCRGHTNSSCSLRRPDNR